MRKFKLFHGYTGKTPIHEDELQRGPAFQRLMDMLHSLDRMVEPNRNNYEILDEINEWDVTLNDGLGEE